MSDDIDKASTPARRLIDAERLTRTIRDQSFSQSASRGIRRRSS